MPSTTIERVWWIAIYRLFAEHCVDMNISSEISGEEMQTEAGARLEPSWQSFHPANQKAKPLHSRKLQRLCLLKKKFVVYINASTSRH
jgi:hypothetical protein